MKDTFSTYHPLINFLYFAAVISFSMFFMHPVFQVIALLSAFAYSVYLKGMKAIRFNLLYMLPMMIFMAILNPLFNHEGVTILFYLESGNPVTLESILYGIASAAMFITIILWFSSYNEIMTSDKFIYLFGRLIPALSLILSMVLRFVPRYKEQIKVISYGQRCIGRDISQGNIIQRAKNGINILSIMTTWALENAIETADSMKARGYGLSGRTSFSIFRLDKRDRRMLLFIIGLVIIIFIGAFKGENGIVFFPSIKLKGMSLFGTIVHAAYLYLCIIPILINVLEEMKWKHTESKL